MLSMLLIICTIGAKKIVRNLANLPETKTNLPNSLSKNCVKWDLLFTTLSYPNISQWQ